MCLARRDNIMLCIFPCLFCSLLRPLEIFGEEKNLVLDWVVVSKPEACLKIWSSFQIYFFLRSITDTLEKRNPVQVIPPPRRLCRRVRLFVRVREQSQSHSSQRRACIFGHMVLSYPWQIFEGSITAESSVSNTSAKEVMSSSAFVCPLSVHSLRATVLNGEPAYLAIWF